MNNKTGFTLIELMVVIAIIGIMTAIAIPNLIPMLRNSQTRSDMRKLFSDIQAARFTAIKNNQNVTITFNSGADSYTIGTISAKTLTATSDLYTNLTGGTFLFNSRGMMVGLPDAVALSGESSENQVPSIFIHQKGSNYYLRCRLSYAGALRIQSSKNGLNWN